MFSAVSFTNPSTATVDLLSTGYILKSLDWSYEYDGSEFPKQSDSGQQPAQSFVRRVVVTATVQIKGTSASDHWTKRGTFVTAFLIKDGAQTVYNHGRLSVTPSGGSAMYVDANVTGLQFTQLSLDEAAAHITTATVTMRADRGYWRAVSGDAVVYL